MMTTEQMMSAHQANVETLLNLSSKAFEGVEKLVELNLLVAKTAFNEAGDNARAALAVKDAQELLALQANLLQPSAEKAAAYSRHVYDIAVSANADLAKVVEAQMSDAQKKTLSLVETATKNAPAGSENGVAMVKAAVTAANNAFESVQKASKQATEMAEANFQAMTNTAKAPKAKRSA